MLRQNLLGTSLLRGSFHPGTFTNFDSLVTIAPQSDFEPSSKLPSNSLGTTTKLTKSNFHSFSNTFKEAPAVSDGSRFMLRPFYLPTNKPIVLIHGLYGYDNIEFDSLPQLQIQYWEGVVEALRGIGVSVTVARVPGTGSVAERAHQLDLFLRKIGAPEFNLIGHSMGGLDGRYLITHIKNKPYRIASLSTVATPHRGSPFMDWCRDNLRVGLSDNSPRDWMGRIMRLLDTPAYAHLTTEYCETHFNPRTPDDPNVAYFSYNAYVDNMPWTNLLRFPWAVIQGVAGQNDGVVPLASGVWGRLVETVHASHFDLVARYRWFVAIAKILRRTQTQIRTSIETQMSADACLSAKPPNTAGKFDNIDFYLRMSTFLRSQGF